jgi:hypothetical protein
LVRLLREGHRSEQKKAGCNGQSSAQV